MRYQFSLSATILLLRTTPYFEEALRRRPGILRRWCEEVAKNPEHTEIQSNGWSRRWGFVTEVQKYLRVIVLEDGETLHNAFFDRRYRGKQ